MRILVVDDEDGGRYLAATILGSAGFEVVQATDGVDALEKARLTPPDAVLSDILMPRMDGYQLLREWKADPGLASIPFIFYTASYTDVADERFAVDLGVDGFLRKPAEPSVLIDTVSAAVSKGTQEAPHRPNTEDETEVLREYSERLVHKLEEKVVDLERVNLRLGDAMSELAREGEVKQRLIEDLNVEIEERALREQELQAERDFSKRVVETAHVSIIGLDLDLRIRLFSPGAERISGWSAGEVSGSTYFERLVPEAARAVRLAQIRELITTGESIRHVGAIVTRTGELRHLEWSGTPSVDTNGATDGVLLFGIDVTERTMAAAVERAMARIDLAVILERPGSEVLDVTCERLVSEFGYSLAFVALREEGGAGLVVKAIAGPAAASLDGVREQLSPARVCPVEQAIESDEIVVSTRSELGSDAAGDELAGFGIEAAAIPLRAHGVTVGAIGVTSAYEHSFDGFRGKMLRRLADRVAIGLLLADGRQRLALQSAALDSAGNGIVIAAIDGTVSWVNQAFSDMTGFSFDEAVGRCLIEAECGELSEESGRGAASEPGYGEAWEVVRAGTTWRGELTSIRKDGSSYIEDVTFAPVRDEDGEITHVAIVKQDLTERREIEQLKSSFTSVVSHELRTPLTSIVGYADLLARTGRVESGSPAERALDQLRDNARRMQDLVERLLEVTQIEAEGVTLDLTWCDIGALVSEATGVLSPPEGLDVEVEVDGDLPLVRCDSGRVRRALGNILDNAVKYSPEGGLVAVTVSPGEGSVLVSVSDEGSGIPPDRVPAAFERFTQIDMSDTRRFGGMGIGLFVAYSIVRAHGGTLLAASEPGSGSTFAMRLPVAGPPGDAPRAVGARRSDGAVEERAGEGPV